MVFVNILIISVFCCVFSISNNDSTVVQYTSKVIQHFIKQHAYCSLWVYDMNDKTSNATDIAGQVLRNLSLIQVPSVMMRPPDFTSYENYGVYPSFILVHYNSKYADQLKQSLKFYVVPVSVKIFVLHSASTGRKLFDIYSCFYVVKFYNTVLLQIENLSMSFYMYYAKKLVKRKTLFDINELFIDQTANLHKYKIYASMTLARPETVIVNDYVVGCDCQWIMQTANYLNGSSAFYMTKLYAKNMTYEQMRNATQFVKGKVMEMNIDNFYSTFMYPEYIQIVTPARIVVVAPHGRQLSAIELFEKPFELDLWIVVLLIIVCSNLIVWLIPAHFKNDPILHAICGFERYSLDRAEKFEKIFTTSLIVFFFFILSAYGSIIITLMTSYPSKPDPRTLDDLLASKVYIFSAENHSDHLIRNNPVIKKLTKIIPRDDGIQLNPRFAYISELNHARLVMNMIENYDVEAAKPSHVVLRDVNLGHNIRFYRLFYPSQLFDRLRQTMQIFYEAGLRDHWSQRVEHHFTTKSQRNISFIFQEPVKKIGLADLEPAWLALAIGSATGTVCCLLELFRCYSKILNLMKTMNKVAPIKRS